MSVPDIVHLDPPAVRALADGLGTAGEQIRVIGRGGALADGVREGLPGAKTPETYDAVSGRADRAMGAVATAMLEMGGTLVGNIVTYEQRDQEVADGLGSTAGEGPR